MLSTLTLSKPYLLAGYFVAKGQVESLLKKCTAVRAVSPPAETTLDEDVFVPARIVDRKAGSGITLRFFCYPGGRVRRSVWLPDYLASRRNGGRRYLPLGEIDTLDFEKTVDETRDYVRSLMGLVDSEPKKKRKTKAEAPAQAEASQDDDSQRVVVPFVGQEKVLDQVEGVLVSFGMGVQQGGNGPFRCYFADVQTKEGTVRKLGTDLERALRDVQASPGCQIRLTKTGMVKAVKEGKPTHKNLWKAEVL